MRSIARVLFVFALAGCNGGVDPGARDLSQSPDLAIAPDLGPPNPPDLAIAPDLANPAAMPITAPKNVWTWVDFPDSVCDEGTPTGLGVKRTDSKDLLVFFNGGGACWDYNTCAQLNTSTHGPFTGAQFAQVANANLTPTAFGDDPANPFKDWNMVFIPYCTGDLHAGDKEVNYMGANGAMRTIRHRGRVNFIAFLRRMAATWPAPGRVAITGSTAGGYGATLNYDLARTAWPQAKSYLVNDSGPSLVGDAVAPSLRLAWNDAWNLGATVGPLCPGCQADLSALYPILVQKYGNDRMALLSTKQDQTIRSYLQLTPMAFEAALDQLAAQRLDPTQRFRVFFEAGQAHTMLGNLAGHTTKNVSLRTWLTQMVTDDAAWASVKP